VTEYEEKMLTQVTRIGDFLEHLSEQRRMLSTAIVDDVSQDIVVAERAAQERKVVVKQQHQYSDNEIKELMAAYRLGGIEEVRRYAKRRRFSSEGCVQKVRKELNKIELQEYRSKLNQQPPSELGDTAN
jgi:hypothetical protein